MEFNSSFKEEEEAAPMINHMVIAFPDEGNVFIGADPSDLTKTSSEMGYKVLIRALKALQNLDDPNVNEVLEKHRIRYEEPKE